MAKLATLNSSQLVFVNLWLILLIGQLQQCLCQELGPNVKAETVIMPSFFLVGQHILAYLC